MSDENGVGADEAQQRVLYLCEGGVGDLHILLTDPWKSTNHPEIRAKVTPPSY